MCVKYWFLPEFVYVCTSVALRCVVFHCVALRSVNRYYVWYRSVVLQKYFVTEIHVYEIFHNIKIKHRNNSYSSGGFQFFVLLL